MIEKFNHFIAVIFILIIVYLMGYFDSVPLLLIGFFIGREHAQAEQRGISKHYGNKRVNAPWYVGFEPASWNWDSFLVDMVLPIVLCIIFQIIVIG